MKILKNLIPLKLPRKNTDAEAVNIWDSRSVAIPSPANISSLNVTAGSSLTILNENRNRLGAQTVANGELLLVDGDVELVGDVIVQNGGEFRII